MLKAVPKGPVTGADYFEQRSRRLSLSFIMVLGFSLFALAPIFFFQLHNIPAGIGAVSGLLVAGISLVLVLRGKQKVGNALFFFVLLLILLSVAASNSHKNEIFAIVLVSIISISFIVIMPTGILISPLYSSSITAFTAIGLAIIIARSGNAVVAQRIPLFIVVYLFGGGIVFVVSRIQNELLRISVDEAEKSAEALSRTQSMFRDMGELRRRMGEAQSVIDQELDGVEEIIRSYDSRISTLDGGSGDLSKELVATGSHLSKLDASVSRITGGVSSQTALIEKNAGTQDRISRSVQVMREKVLSAEEANTDLEQSALRGKAEVESVVASIQRLGQFQEQLSGVNKVIMKIASQTNMLAMNASIEAAHAGAYGHGFAVVADEVRTLSDESNLRTKEISTIIKTMDSMMKESTQLALRAGGSLREITEKVQFTAPVIREVYTTMQDYMEKLQAMLSDTASLVAISKELDETAGNQTGIFSEFGKTYGVLSACSSAILRDIRDLADYSRKALSSIERIDAVRRESEELNVRVEELLKGSQA